ncbi:hypothetical protein KP509_12G081700 [Ceratopteris richardii]|uniref:Protein POLLENLESS 3-LIKE 2 n=1 Tax=Ceratopteris richardii TaxID=49495 RepID=A0A8T2TML8_CERRI|nr:hypothetical protein KP509_12G081700 [Ceratopteris richardii]
MWNDQLHQQTVQALLQGNGAQQPRLTKSAPCSPLKPLLTKRPPPARADSFHVIHKVPVGDTPYVKAKHVQLVDKDPNRAIALFWAAINAGDRVDSALKDMAIVMKQQNRPEEAIEAIKSLRHRCSDHAQESLDNVLLDLYKRCGRLDDQITLLKHKLHLIHQGLAFNGRRTKTARSQGKKFQVSIEQEATRLLGNLGWAYMQQSNYVAAEAVYRKALSIEPDNNKVCNLGICLMKQGRIVEAKAMLKSVKPASSDSPWGSDSHLKSYERAQQMLQEIEGGGTAVAGEETPQGGVEDAPLLSCSSAVRLWSHQNPLTDTDFSGALYATAGFGPVQRPPLPPTQAAPEPLLPHQPRGVKHAQRNGKWAEEDEEQGFANENSGQDMKLDILRQKLEKAIAVGGDLNKRTGREAASNSNSSLLNSSALPYVSKAIPKSSMSSLLPAPAVEDARPAGRTQLPLTFDSANRQPMSLHQKPPSQKIPPARTAPPSQLVLPDRDSIAKKLSCCKSLSFSGDSAGDDNCSVGSSNKSDVSSPDGWSRLGFIQGDLNSPLCTIATALRRRFNSNTGLPKSNLQEDCQRRLPVFVDMTVSEGPQAAV